MQQNQSNNGLLRPIYDTELKIALHLIALQESFSTVGLSIVKVSVMMVGEFEYDDTFISSITGSNEKTKNPLNPFPEIALIFMFAFLFLMAIILMNLLVGKYSIICKQLRPGSKRHVTPGGRVFDPWLGIRVPLSVSNPGPV